MMHGDIGEYIRGGGFGFCYTVVSAKHILKCNIDNTNRSHRSCRNVFRLVVNTVDMELPKLSCEHCKLNVVIRLIVFRNEAHEVSSYLFIVPNLKFKQAFA